MSREKERRWRTRLEEEGFDARGTICLASPASLSSTNVRLARGEKIFGRTHFFLACGDDSCMLRMRTHSTAAARASSLRRTRVKIEFFIASHPATFPRHPNNKKKSREAHALAACGRHVFHGVRRHVWHGGNYSRSGLRPRDIDPAVPASAVVLAYRVHDWRTVERASARGRLLRLGSARFGKFLGLSGSVALAGRKYF
jgi:uncharacterized protein (UPF0548 family)